MKITMAQLNPVVGDIEGNLRKIVELLPRCVEDSSDLLVLPELFLVGYPPRDLLERPSFITRTREAVEKLIEISREYPETGILVGAPWKTESNTDGGLYNSAILVYRGEVLLNQPKSLLPICDVFDEARYFDPAPEIRTVRFKDEVLGISICEDAWNGPGLWPRRNHPFNPIEILAEKGATLFINISASPFHIGKEMVRYHIAQNHARKHGVPFVFVNQVGANDELIFDGRSLCVDRFGEPVEVFPPFKEQVKTVDVSLRGKGPYTPQDEIESVHDALVLGIRDYMKKCGFSRAVVGLSGGIDSSVTCCLAKQALGSENVLGVAMPSPYSPAESVEHARKLAENLGIQFRVIPISDVYQAYLETLKDYLNPKGEVEVAMENIQARIRGNILMALSNKFGYLVLSTGNKSELAVGYCTLYGDMSGGLAVLSDVPKTMVYRLAHYINREFEVIPHEVIEKPPSAELRPGQKDQDTLPPYEVLDKILHHYIDRGLSKEEIVNLGFDRATVEWVVRAVNKNEYKRRQAPPGLQVTPKAFGTGRRMVIAAKVDI